MARDPHSSSVKKLNKLLFDEPSSIQNLVKKAQTIQQTGQKLQSLLEPELQNRFILANINQDVAVLHTQSSAWATRLRYHIPVILNILNQQLGLENIKTVRIKITPVLTEKVSPKRKQTLSSETANYLAQVAEGYSDSRLRDALLRISRKQNTSN